MQPTLSDVDRTPRVDDINSLATKWTNNLINTAKNVVAKEQSVDESRDSSFLNFDVATHSKKSVSEQAIVAAIQNSLIENHHVQTYNLNGPNDFLAKTGWLNNYMQKIFKKA